MRSSEVMITLLYNWLFAKAIDRKRVQNVCRNFVLSYAQGPVEQMFAADLADTLVFPNVWPSCRNMPTEQLWDKLTEDYHETFV